MFPAKLEIVMKNGQVFSAEEYYPKGFPKNRMSAEEMEDKFESLCAYVFDKTKTNEVKHMIKEMESLNNIDDLVKLMSRG
jgi:2-methylcitrate dehydratase